MEDPQIHAFSDAYPHRAEDLNAMGIAVMDLVSELRALRAELDELKASKGTARKTA